MLAFERHQRIVQLLARRKSLRTAEAARALGVTEETIRRDFEKLEKEGDLVRTHGGVHLAQENRRDLSFSSREATNVPAKREIARRAAREIAPGETILLDGSSSALELARQLPEAPLRVLTNAVKVALELASRPSVDVILLGGAFSPRSFSTLGPLAEQALDQYQVQRAFVSCRGVDAERGLSEANEEQGRLRRKMVLLAERTYLLADRAKIPLQSAFFFARLSEIDALVTEAPPPPAFAKALAAAGVEVLLAGEPPRKRPSKQL